MNDAITATCLPKKITNSWLSVLSVLEYRLTTADLNNVQDRQRRMYRKDVVFRQHWDFAVPPGTVPDREYVQLRLLISGLWHRLTERQCCAMLLWWCDLYSFEFQVDLWPVKLNAAYAELKRDGWNSDYRNSRRRAARKAKKLNKAAALCSAAARLSGTDGLHSGLDLNASENFPGHKTKAETERSPVPYGRASESKPELLIEISHNSHHHASVGFSQESQSIYLVGTNDPLPSPKYGDITRTVLALSAAGNSRKQIAEIVGKSADYVKLVLKRARRINAKAPQPVKPIQISDRHNIEDDLADWPYNAPVIENPEQSVSEWQAEMAEQWRSSLTPQKLGKLRKLCIVYAGDKSPDFRTWKQRFMSMPAREAEEMIDRLEWRRRKAYLDAQDGMIQDVVILLLAGNYVEALDAFKILNAEQAQECRVRILDLAYDAEPIAAWLDAVEA
jgi:hypothetical protein